MSRHFARRTLAPLLLALALAAAWPTAAAGDCTTPPKPARLAPATVERVSDGDTVILRLPDGRRKRTRLIGIDAPEIHDNQKLQRAPLKSSCRGSRRSDLPARPFRRFRGVPLSPALA